jgi:type I restriction enzyme, S subunit
MIEGWTTNRLRDILELVYGKSLSKQTRQDGNVPVYGSNGIVGYHNEAFVNQEGIIVGRKGSAGNVALSKVPFCPIDTTFYLTQEHTKLDLEFLFYALEKLDLKRILGDVGVPGLNREMAYLEELTYPKERNEQRKISYVLSTIQKSIEQHDKLIRTSTELKKALMQKLFTEGMKGEKQKQTEVGLVPESWEVVRVGDIYDFTSKPRGLKVEFPTPFIPMENVPINERTITTYELRNSVSSGTYVENGDLLLAKITPSFENGKQGFVEIDKPYSFATTEVIPFKAKEEISDLNYLYYFLLKDDIRKQLTDKMEGSTGRQRLSKPIIEETFIPKPLVEEQIEISNVLISLDKRISIRQKEIRTLTELFKTLLNELMTGQRRVNEIDFQEQPIEYKLTKPNLSIALEN